MRRGFHEHIFWSRVEKTDSCWIWTGTITKWGYGKYGNAGAGRSTRAHRIAYELLVGPVPEGLVLDHLCRNKLCVNPAHLEPVTNRENVLRGTGPGARNAAKTECDRGHPLTPDNLFNRTEDRICKTCRSEQFRRDHRRHRVPAGSFGDSRTRVLLEIVRQPHPTARSVAEGAGISLACTWRHMRLLRDDGLIDWQPERRGTLRPLVRPVGIAS